MAENSIKPRIRFKGYTDAWEQRKLCGIAEKVLEKNKNTSITETFTNSAEFGIISQRDYFDHDISNINNLSDYYVVQNDDFIYNPRISANAPVGPINRNKLGRKGVMSPLYTVFRASNIDFAFLEWYFKSEHWHGFMKFNGDSGARSDRFSIKDEIMFQMPLPYPNINEQERVGKFLSKIDNLITLHQRKYDKFVNIKKALLEKMFPQGDETTPKIRFKGFTDAWEQRKLGDIGETYGGLSGKSGEDFGHGNAKFVTYMNVFTNPIADTEMTESIEIDSRQVQVKIGDVFFTTSSETPEEVGMSSVWLKNEENIYLNSFCFGYRPKITMNSYYLAYMLRSVEIREKIVFLAQGISRYNISKKKMMEITIPLPSDSEQSKLGSIFKQLDNLITLHQRQLEKLKNIKSALLEKMFV